MPQGYCRPRIFLPATSMMQLDPITAKGMDAFNSRSCCLKSSSSSESHSGNWYICGGENFSVYVVVKEIYFTYAYCTKQKYFCRDVCLGYVKPRVLSKG